MFSKKVKLCVTNFRDCETISFFVHKCEISFFLFHLFTTEYNSARRNKVYYKMPREMFYNLYRKAYFNCVSFVLKKSKILCDQFLQPQQLVAHSFAFFENKTYTIGITFTMYTVELFTLHLVVYFVF